MNLVLHEIGAVAYLHLYALICGVFISTVYSVLVSIPLLFKVLNAPRFQKFSQFRESLKTEHVESIYRAFSDILISVLLACVLLSVTFVYNSGNFRLFSIVSILIGFFIGCVTFGKPVAGILTLLFYILKIITDVVLLPISWMTRLFSRVVFIVRNKYITLYRQIAIKSHTKYTIKNAAEYVKNGFLENYEEYLK